MDFRGLGLGAGGGRGGGGSSERWQMRELAKQEHFDWPIIKRALGGFVPYWPRAILVTLVILATSAGGTLPAWLTQRIIDDGINKGKIEVVITLTGAVVFTSIATGLLGVLQTWLSNVIAQDVMADYRMLLFRHLQRQTIQFFASRQTGDLVSRIMNDVTAIQNVITTTLVGFVSNLLTIVMTLALMFTMDWRLTLLAIVVVPGFVLPTQRVGRTRQRLQADIQQWLSNMTIQLSETLGVSGSMLIRIFNRQKTEEKRFEEATYKLRDLQVRQTLVGRWLFMWLGMFSSIGPALLWGYGGWLVIHHQIGLGVIVAFTTLLGRLYGPISQLAQLHVSILSSIALFRRIFAILDLKPDVEDGPDVLTAEKVAGAIEIRNVSFAYPSKEGSDSSQSRQAVGPKGPRLVLRDISITVEPGQTVALVGPSGAGKTTLMNLVPRFLDPLSGSVLLDHHDIRSLTQESLRSQMGLVPQDSFFFHDTVANNLRVAKEDATPAEMEEACRAAQIHDTIALLPQGYETVVGERGYRLSGGERQRLAIARVLLQGPRVVLLDEATSALDTVVERRIQEALFALLKGRTAIVIAHRLSTVLSADKIVVIEGGRVVAEGTHHQLLAASPLYHMLYETQFGATRASG